ncbi:MAG: hypothetical protein IJO26_05430 [Clostridium sp.]|nr:hypothetical protein [Clostridium sp.]
MKKLLAIIISISLLLISCSNNEKATEDIVNEVIFKATVIQIGEGTITVKPDEDSTEYKSSDTIVITTKNIEDEETKELLTTLSTGDLISIKYNGSIIESYPARINKVYKIELI